MSLKEIGYDAERDRICCWKRQNKLLEEIGYVVETVSIFVAQQLLCACITADTQGCSPSVRLRPEILL